MLIKYDNFCTFRDLLQNIKSRILIKMDCLPQKRQNYCKCSWTDPGFLVKHKFGRGGTLTEKSTNGTLTIPTPVIQKVGPNDENVVSLADILMNAEIEYKL